MKIFRKELCSKDRQGCGLNGCSDCISNDGHSWCDTCDGKVVDSETMMIDNSFFVKDEWCEDTDGKINFEYVFENINKNEEYESPNYIISKDEQGHMTIRSKSLGDSIFLHSGVVYKKKEKIKKLKFNEMFEVDKACVFKLQFKDSDMEININTFFEPLDCLLHKLTFTLNEKQLVYVYKNAIFEAKEI